MGKLLRPNMTAAPQKGHGIDFTKQENWVWNSWRNKNSSKIHLPVHLPQLKKIGILRKSNGSFIA